MTCGHASPAQDQHGSATVLAAVLMAALMGCAMLVTVVGEAVTVQRRVEAAADLHLRIANSGAGLTDGCGGNGKGGHDQSVHPAEHLREVALQEDALLLRL